MRRFSLRIGFILVGEPLTYAAAAAPAAQALPPTQAQAHLSRARSNRKQRPAPAAQALKAGVPTQSTLYYDNGPVTDGHWLTVVVEETKTVTRVCIITTTRRRKRKFYSFSSSVSFITHVVEETKLAQPSPTQPHFPITSRDAAFEPRRDLARDTSSPPHPLSPPPPQTNRPAPLGCSDGFRRRIGGVGGDGSTGNTTTTTTTTTTNNNND